MSEQPTQSGPIVRAIIKEWEKAQKYGISRYVGPHAAQALENLKDLAEFIGPQANIIGMQQESAETVEAVKQGEYGKALAHLGMATVEVADLAIPVSMTTALSLAKMGKSTPDGVVKNNFVGYSAPDNYSRNFEEDYPNGYKATQEETLTHDMEGRELNVGGRIAGLQKVRGSNEKIRADEYPSISRAGTGGDTVIGDLGPDWGETAFNINTGMPTEVRLSEKLSGNKRDIVYGHEIGHVIDQLAGEIPTKGLNKELREVYNTLNNPQKHGKPVGPQHAGYQGEDIPRELMAEAIRAYMEAPAYLKTVAPKTAARIRANVNDNPKVKHIIQFNSAVAAPLAMIAAADRNAEVEAQKSTQGIVSQFMANNLQKDLIEAITGIPMTNSVQVNGKDIPIGHPEVLSRQDVFDLMRSKEYNQAARVNHKQTVDTVRGFFEQASPGKVSLANGQRATSTINDIPDRPSTAPAGMKDLGPIGSSLSFDQQEKALQEVMDRRNAERDEFERRERELQAHMDQLNEQREEEAAKKMVYSIAVKFTGPAATDDMQTSNWRGPNLATIRQQEMAQSPYEMHTMSTSYSQTLSAQMQVNQEEQTEQARLDQARKNVAKQHQDYVSSSRAEHVAKAKATQEESVSPARATNPDFDAKHGLAASSASSTAEFGNKTGPTTGQLSTPDTEDQIKAQNTLASATGFGLNTGQALETLGAGRNTKEVGRAKAERAAAIGQEKVQQDTTKEQSEGKSSAPYDSSNDPDRLETKTHNNKPDLISDTLNDLFGMSRNYAGYQNGQRTKFSDTDMKARTNASGGTAETRVICTELLRQQLFDRELYDLDIAYSQLYLSPVTIRGYHVWAVPLVRKMRQSDKLTQFIRPFAVARAKEIAFKMGARPQGHILGKIVRLIGEPLCYVVGLLCEESSGGVGAFDTPSPVIR